MWIVVTSILFGTKLLMFILFKYLVGGHWTLGKHWKTLTLYFSFRNELCLLEPISKFKWSNELNYCELNQFRWLKPFTDYASIQIYFVNIKHVKCATLNLYWIDWIKIVKKGGCCWFVVNLFYYFSLLEHFILFRA